ncbi:MAG: HlyD family efflux transporter periplasmic adaptor subunit [Eubacteriales bacterium]|nr:HlyD family efflux transporter periplasmic adaptor subunit [Eubacteriales bacterium]
MENRARAVLVITAVALAGLLLWAWGSRPPAPVSVQTGRATERDIYNSVTISDTVEAVTGTAVSPAAHAVVTAVCVAVGDTVQQGDLLCTLRPLAQPSAAAGAQAVWSALSGGQAGQTVAAPAGAVLRAPVDGVVLALPAAGETVVAGVPCVQVSDLRALRVRAQSPELYADALAPGQRANVTAAAVAGTTYAAQVERVSPVAVRPVSLTGQRSEATVEVLLTLDGRTTGLRPGYSASVKVFTDRRADAVVVPHEAICQRGAQEYVFCVQQGRAIQCAVRTGYLLETVTEIVDGVPPEAVVVLSPPDTLTDGAAVTVAA